MDIGLITAARRTMPVARGPHRRRSRTATAWALWTVAIANAVVIIGLWVRGGNLSGVHGLGPLHQPRPPHRAVQRLPRADPGSAARPPAPARAAPGLRPP